MLSEQIVRKLLDLIFEQFHWFVPVSYLYWKDRPIKRGRLDMEALIACYKDMGHIIVNGFAERDFVMFHPTAQSEYPYVGDIHWRAQARQASKKEWRVAHQEQTKHLMRMVNSPYAMTAFWDDYERKAKRWVPRTVGYEQILIVRDYSEGLAGLYWRNFFGPPFVRMFGERLGSLPSDCVKDLGDGIVLVEPYALPTDADSDAGKAREREFIQLLGPECFYDHEHHVPPRKRPDLSDLPSNPEPA